MSTDEKDVINNLNCITEEKDNIKTNKKSKRKKKANSSKDNNTHAFIIEDIPPEAQQQVFDVLARAQKHIDTASYYFRKGDIQKALSWYRLAAKISHPFAHLMIVEILEKNFLTNPASGITNLGYLKEWIDNLAALANTKNREAAFRLGLFYFRGDFNYVPDLAVAFKWFSLAAEDEFRPYAIFYKALCLIHGFGVAKNETEGLRLLNKAADMKHVEAMIELAHCYKEGNEVTQDLNHAFLLVKEAADLIETQENPDPKTKARAETLLSHYYMEGIGVTVDKVKGLEILRKIDASHMTPKLVHVLASTQNTMEDTPEGQKQAFAKLKKNADAGHVESMKKVSQNYFNGEGTSVDKKMGMEYLLKAAESRDADALCTAGTLYFSGTNIKKDHKMALKYFKKAFQELHYEPARFNLGQCWVMHGTEEERKKGFELLKSINSSDHNAFVAKFRLSWCYALGRGVVRDEQRAVILLEECLNEDSENISCKNLLANTLLFAKGGLQDRDRGLQLLQQAEVEIGEQRKYSGYGDVHLLLAYCHLCGYGVEKDIEKAVSHLQKSASTNQLAQLMVAMCHFHGFGLPVDRGKAIHTLKTLVSENNPVALNVWGVLVLKGWQGEKEKSEKPNPKKAFNLFTQAKSTDNAHHCMDSVNNIGWCYLHGIGVEQNYMQAVKCFEEARALGHCAAINNLAWCYLNGLGVSKDFSRANQLFLEAKERQLQEGKINTFGITYLSFWSLESEWLKLEQNFGIEGQYHLAICYLNGFGVTQDQKKALEILSNLASHHHYPAAMLALGKEFLKTGKQDKEAFELFSKVANVVNVANPKVEAHSAVESLSTHTASTEPAFVETQFWKNHAYVQLALCRMFGRGVVKNFKQGVELLNECAKLGHPLAQFHLAQLYQMGKHPDKPGVQDKKLAFELFSQAAAQGHKVSRRYLAYYFEQGSNYENGTLKDDKSAYEHYRIAAEQGDAIAQHNLAIMLEIGKGVEQNKCLAFEYYHRSAHIGDYVLGWYHLGRCHELGIGTPINIKQALRCYQEAASAGHEPSIAIIEPLQKQLQDMVLQDKLQEVLEKEEQYMQKKDANAASMDALDLLALDGLLEEKENGPFPLLISKAARLTQKLQTDLKQMATHEHSTIDNDRNKVRLHVSASSKL